MNATVEALTKAAERMEQQAEFVRFAHETLGNLSCNDYDTLLEVAHDLESQAAAHRQLIARIR